LICADVLRRQRLALLRQLIQLFHERASERHAVRRSDERQLVAAYADGDADFALDSLQI
jgi:hypothetical protein